MEALHNKLPDPDAVVNVSVTQKKIKHVHNISTSPIETENGNLNSNFD